MLESFLVSFWFRAFESSFLPRNWPKLIGFHCFLYFHSKVTWLPRVATSFHVLLPECCYYNARPCLLGFSTEASCHVSLCYGCPALLALGDPRKVFQMESKGLLFLFYSSLRVRMSPECSLNSFFLALNTLQSQMQTATCNWTYCSHSFPTTKYCLNFN